MTNRGAEPGATPRIAFLAITIALLGSCDKSEPKAAPPPMDVLVTEVVQKDVSVHQEWIGTTTGMINAEIRPQVQGYILTKNYKEGDVVQAGALLFQIDPREFQAKLDQAQGDLARAPAAAGQEPLHVESVPP